MADLETTTNSIMSAPAGASEARHAERLGAGHVHLEFDEDDHVFLVEVTQVPRRHLLETAPVHVGRVGDVQVQLVDVVLDNRLNVVLEGRPAAGQSQDAPGERGWPAHQLMQIGLILTDDLGTCYTTWTAESGGETHPRRAVRRFLPTPPADATVLHIALRTDPQDREVVLSLPVAAELAPDPPGDGTTSGRVWG